MKQIKVLELISGVEFEFSSCLTDAINLKCRDMSMQVKEATIRLTANEDIYQRDNKINNLPNSEKTKHW